MTARGRRADGDASSFVRLSKVVRATMPGDVSEEASVAGRERLVAAFRQHRRHRSARVAWGGVSVLAAGAAAAQLFHAPAGGLHAESRAYGNGYVSAGGGTNPTVRFASGPVVEFARGSRGRIGDLKGARARFVLEGGRARVHDEADPQQDFLIEAGPYALRSGGAAFDVSWSGSVLEVRVASGAVSVEGPEARQGLVLHEDQAFVAREAGGEIRCF